MLLKNFGGQDRQNEVPAMPELQTEQFNGHGFAHVFPAYPALQLPQYPFPRIPLLQVPWLAMQRQLAQFVPY